MDKTKVTFIESNKALVETPCGDNFIVSFGSELNYAMDSQYDDIHFTEFFGSLFDRFYKGDDSVIMGEINRQLMIHNCASIFSYGRDKVKERLHLGERIKQLRTKKGIAACQLAQEAGIDAANLCRIEKGKYSPGFDVLCKIAFALGMRIDFVELNSSDSNGSL